MKQEWMHKTGWFILSALLAVSCCGRCAERYWDIEYGTADSARLVLDAGVPDGPQLRPAVILIHGGGWSSGDKKDMAFLTEPLSEAGFVWFSINYRLAPAYRWPACLDDVKTAIRWVKAHAQEYKTDASRIGLIGYSAGGHLACMAAVTADEQTRVQAVAGIAPPTDHEADSQRRGGLSPSLQNLLDRPQEITDQTRLLLQRISPIQYVNAGLPPFLLIHGTDDASVPYSQSVEFKAKLDHYNAPCRFITIQGAGHRLSDWPKQEYLTPMTDWLKQTLDIQRSVPPQPAVQRKTIAKTVAQDGSGDFASVQAAVDAVPDGNGDTIVIAIKPGVYKERILVPRHKRFIRFEGTDAQATVLTFDLYAGMKDAQGKEIGTFRTPSVTIEADDFAAENITFENSAGPVGQAVAIAVFGDRVVFRNCRFLGWQDTILDHIGRHYYENCYIAGHCDFIFGGGTAFFEKCRIECLKNGYITAASTPEKQRFGYVFSNCTITGQPQVKTYLGRPWRDYANVLFLNTEMSETVRPEGWHNWDKPYRESTARFGEYNSRGPGAAPQARVSWARRLTDAQAAEITLQAVLGGEDGWNPLLSRPVQAADVPAQ